MKGVSFNGNYLIKPGAYAHIDAESMFKTASDGQKLIAFIGEAAGGTPHELMWFDDLTVAKKVLKDGDLLKACEKAWAPVKKDGSVGEGAHIIGVIRVNNATKSYLDMGDGIAVLSSIGPIKKKSTNKGVITEPDFTVKGTYTGKTDKTVDIYIDSEGTKDYTAVTFRWRFSGDTAWANTTIQAYAEETGGDTELTDGVILSFTGGTFAYGDMFSFELHSEKNQRIAARIESKDYGLLTRKIQVKYGDGSFGGTKRLTVYNSLENQYEVFDDIGATMTIAYRGTHPFAQAEIKHGPKGTAESLKIRLGETEETAEEYITINLAEDRFKKLKSVVDYISSFEDFECELYDKLVNDIVSSDLDEAKINIANTNGVMIAYWADMVKRISVQSQYITVTKVYQNADVPLSFDYTSLAGGDDGTVPASWLEFFDMLGPHPITYLVPLTGDEAIHAEAREHVVKMSKLGRERFLILGGWKGETVSKAIDRARTHAIDRVQVVTPGFYDRDKYGELILYPPYITAAMQAGRAAFLNDGESSTFNIFNVDALEYEFQPEQINTLLSNGVACFEYVMGKGHRMVQDMTTYIDDSSASLYTERSVRILADGFNKHLRETLESLYVGKGASYSSVASCKNAVISFLKQKLKEEVILSYRNVSIKKDGKALYVEYEVAPIEPTNYVLITGHFYSENISA